jgi:hypothetical protein
MRGPSSLNDTRMSMGKHATVSAWQRSEHGGYEAEINGWALRVAWNPERKGEQRGFSWEATKGAQTKKSEARMEEIELAMAAAESAADGTSES